MRVLCWPCSEYAEEEVEMLCEASGLSETQEGRILSALYICPRCDEVEDTNTRVMVEIPITMKADAL